MASRPRSGPVSGVHSTASAEQDSSGLARSRVPNDARKPSPAREPPATGNAAGTGAPRPVPAHRSRPVRHTGLLVAATTEGTPAAPAGLARGDLIVAADGIECRSEDVLAQAIDRA